MSGFPSKCLLCLVKVEPPTDSSSIDHYSEEFSPFHIPADTGEEESTSNLSKKTQSVAQIDKSNSILQRQLDVIFLLRNVLHLPITNLKRFLKTCGNPSNWISLCGSCSELVDNVKDLFLQLQRISKKYDELKRQIDERIRVSSLLNELDIGNDFILEECRKIVCKRQPLVEQKVCFREGDLKARRLLLLQNNKQMGDDEADDDDVTKMELEEDEAATSVEVRRAPTEGRSLQNRRKIYLGESGPMTPEEFYIKDEGLVSNLDSEDDRQSISSFSSCYNPSVASGSCLSNTPNMDDEDSDEYSGNPCKEESEGPFSAAAKSSGSEITPKDQVVSYRVQESLKQKVCHVCQKGFRKGYSLKVHLFKFHKIEVGGAPLKWHPCNVEGCDKLFFAKFELKRHLEWHKKVPNCEICNKDFRNQYCLDKHQFYIHKIVKETTKNLQFFDCPTCEFRCPDKKRQKSHSVTCKGRGDLQAGNDRDVDDDQFPCPHCEKVFLGEYKLDKHIKTVHSGSSFNCPMCPKKFSGRSPLLLHMARRHQVGAENHTCTKCNKFFRLKARLKSHTCEGPDLISRCHYEKQEGSWKCSKCEYRNRNKQRLLVHVASKHEIGIKCEVESCSRYFPSEVELDNHKLKMHPPGGRVKSFKCTESEPECGRAFYTHHDLRRHVKEVHLQIKKKTKPSKCEFCGKVYPSSSQRSLHVRKAHKNEGGSEMITSSTNI